LGKWVVGIFLLTKNKGPNRLLGKWIVGILLLTKNKGPNRLYGKWQKKGGGRTQIEHSMLVNASVQKNPDDSGFSELVHLRALKTGVVPGAQGPDYVQKKIIGKREREKRKQRGRKELGLRDSRPARRFI